MYFGAPESFDAMLEDASSSISVSAGAPSACAPEKNIKKKYKKNFFITTLYQKQNTEKSGKKKERL